MATRHYGCQELTMLALPLRVLLKSSFGKKKRRLDMITEGKISLKKFGSGKMSMEAGLTINSRDTELVSIGKGLLLHLMKRGLLL